MCKEWRSKVTDDVKLVVDGDTLLYNAASANQNKTFHVYLKDTGEEFFKEKNVEVTETVCTNPYVLGAFYNGSEEPIYEKRNTGKFINKHFSNKTEFKGLTRKTISGWLGEHNQERIAQGKEPYSVDDFRFEETFEPNNINFAYSNFDRKLKEIKDYLGIQEAIILVGSGECHRHGIDMPVDPSQPDNPLRGRYKGRRDAPKPLQLEEVKQYVIKKYNAVEITGIECDDALNIHLYKSHLHYVKTGKHFYVGVSVDKDQAGFPGMIYNYMKDNDKKWKHPYPYLITGLGELHIEDNGDIKGTGHLWRLTQLLIGDLECDGFSPTRYLGIRYGKKSAYDALHNCKTLKEACEVCVAQYWKWFPSGEVTFTSWRGYEVTLTTWEWMDRIWTMLYMLKSRDDQTTFTSILDHLGVPYKTNPNVEEPNKNETEEENL